MRSVLVLVFFSKLARGHITAFTKGMYCLNGTVVEVDNQNNNDPVQPLYMLTKKHWWMHHVNNCDQFPPAPGEYLEVPARGSFTVEMAGNRAQTSFSYGGQFVSAWPDGKDHPHDYSDSRCILSPNLHAQNETMAAGTAFAISYQSDINKVTEENLVVFTVKYHTPWKRLTTYKVPDLPECPPGGCHCIWGWIPNHCGQPNMYMFPHKCIVTGATSTTPLAPAKPPIWCEDDQSRCLPGPKQMIFWNQLDGNNVITEGTQLDGDWKSPGYNQKMGFKEGAQMNIFVTPLSTSLPLNPITRSSSTIPDPTTETFSATPTPAAESITSSVSSTPTVTITPTQTVFYCPTSAIQASSISTSTITVTVTQMVSSCPSAQTDITPKKKKHQKHRQTLSGY